MPAIDITFLESLKENYKNYKTFIETGTYLAETICHMEQYFDKLYTIEINENLYANAKKSYSGNKIEFILGDSSKVFVSILPNIDEDALFFLDGHWSSGITGKGEKDCPLIEEISQINEMFKNKAMIIVDDCRLFGKGPKDGKGYPEDWTNISSEKLLDILKERLIDFYYLDSSCSKNDRLIINIDALQEMNQ